MNIEECRNHYLELKKGENFIESIEPSFFFKFAETLLTAYEKEKEKNKELEILLKRQEELDKEKENLIKQGWLNE